jgi:hypothetical protein
MINDHYSSNSFQPSISSYASMRIFHGLAATIYYNKGDREKEKLKMLHVKLTAPGL